MSTTIESTDRISIAGPQHSSEQSEIKIEGYDQMEPFLMTLVSDSDLWMYVSSLGSITAGRVDEDHCLFPYCVEDMIHRTAGKTGTLTTFRIWHPDGTFEIWEPFSGISAPAGSVRTLSKSVLGNLIVFEEQHSQLGLSFRYQWASTDEFGFVRTATLVNDGLETVRVDLIDGILNMLPPGLSYSFLQRMSVLVDAYTECDVDPVTGVVTISLASLIVDKPEPGEALHASVVWSRGLDQASTLLSLDQLAAFQKGHSVVHETSMKGRRANFLISHSLNLDAGASRSWDIVSDTHRSQSQVEDLRAYLLSDPDPRNTIRQNLESSSENLARYVAAADGQPCTADGAADRHHEACVLFNIMRGGIFAAGDHVATSDFRHFVETRSKRQAQKHGPWLSQLPNTMVYSELLSSASKQNDSDLSRIAYEYLPLTFSRRHGDPSRPWNRFAIRLKNPDGSPLLAYEGNWRDIFQNWEALSLSYPMFIESIIAKFVNASTIDGYNPYRITREGIDWEVPSPDDPWAALGYWGDHQIIYLLKFLEQAAQIRPEGLSFLLGQRLFSYANVPLRLRPYEAMVRDPHSTIDFDFALNTKIETQVKEFGSDAKLLTNSDGEVIHVTLAEKLLVPALSKLSNLVLDAGIWMNTQRPEWNDANNALVGNGVSMVTLCYLRRYLAFCKTLFADQAEPVLVSAEVIEWLGGITGILEEHQSILNQKSVTDEQRRTLLNDLGQQFSNYRHEVYANGFVGQDQVDAKSITRLFECAIPYLDHSIRASKRTDGLYHSYNLVDLREQDRATVSHLYEMLEGQVAVLSAGVLDASEVALLVQALFDSKIYRSDQETFMLYPERKLRGFLEKNVIPGPLVRDNPLLQGLLTSGDTRVILQDASGNFRFASDLRNASALTQVLGQLSEDPQWTSLVEQHGNKALEAYEAVFGHRFFTGRSGSMYGYEGLGSIYWHMVSKLLVAVQESFFEAVESGASAEERRSIVTGYYRIRSGMGFNKTPQQFGAFPSDPYSHTPAGRGAKQPGMTGQSKEDILSRWMEFGVFSKAGKLIFHPAMLRRNEFLVEPRVWNIRDLDGYSHEIELPKESLGFTVCGVPIIYHLNQGTVRTTVDFTNGNQSSTPGAEIPETVSQEIYSRSGRVDRITVYLTEGQIFGS